MARALVKINELDQFDDAALVKAKVAALFTSFIVKPNPDDAILGEGEPDEDGAATAAATRPRRRRTGPTVRRS